MSVDKTLRGVFDRTCQRLLQMVIATDLPSNGSMEEDQLKSDAVSGNIKGASSLNTRTERQNTRSLRSNSIRHNTNCITKNGIQERNNHERDNDHLMWQSEALESHENPNCKFETTDSQVTQLRQLLLLHLELIQQQQEKLQKKDRELNQLKIDKEQLESRIQRMERRMAVKKRRGDFSTNDLETVHESTKRTAPKSRRISSEQMIRSKRVPATSSVVISSDICDNISFDTNMRTELLYLHPKATQSVKVETPKTKLLENKLEDNQSDNKEGDDVTNILVPCWKWNEVPPSGHKGGRSISSSRSSNSSEPVENIDDEAFLKRHLKQETEEKRRKRWDVQRFRAQQIHKTLEEKNRMREELRLKGRKFKDRDTNSDSDNTFQSFLPSNEEIIAIEVSETVPVSVFGWPVPLFQMKEFEVPWFSLDRRELQERATKGRGRSRGGRSRGRGRGWGRGRGRGRTV